MVIVDIINTKGGFEMNQIEKHIERHLNGEIRKAASSFVSFLSEHNVFFYKDNCECWKDKIYYWVKLNDECVCFIAIADPDEPDNYWTVWSEGSEVYESEFVDEQIKTTGWKYVDFCGNCGSCGGGKQKIIFGKTFDKVCGCTFRIDNAIKNDLPFLNKMAEMRINEIKNKNI